MKKVIATILCFVLVFAFAGSALAASRTYSVSKIKMSISPSVSITKSTYESWSNVKIRPTRLSYFYYNASSGQYVQVYTYNYHRACLTDYSGNTLGGRIDAYLNNDAYFSSTAANGSSELRVRLYNRYYLATNSPSDNMLYTDGTFSGSAS